MKIKFKINGIFLTINKNPAEKLSNVLRENRYISVKNGCHSGKCGSCTILMNNTCVASCKISLAQADGSEIVTLESFGKTTEYIDIKKGFEQAGVSMCGYCNAAKIFAAHSIITKNPRPTKEEIKDKISYLQCSCTDTDTLVNGIYFAAASRRARSKEKAK